MGSNSDQWSIQEDNSRGFKHGALYLTNITITKQAGIRDSNTANDRPYNRTTKARQDPRKDKAQQEDSYGTLCLEGMLKTEHK